MDKINKKFKNVFRRDRLKLVTLLNSKKVELLENLEIISVRWDDEEEEQPNIVVNVKSKNYTGYLFHCAYGSHYMVLENINEEVVFSDDEGRIIGKWFDEFEIKNYLKKKHA